MTRSRRCLVGLLWGIGAVLAVAAVLAGWAFQQARQRARALDAAARDYVDWLRSGNRQAGVELGAELRFARALGVRSGAAPAAAALDDDGSRVRRTLAARLARSAVAKQVDASALRLGDAAWRCNRANDCTRRDARRLDRALRELDGALAHQRARLHLAGARLPLGGSAPPRLSRPVPVRGSALLADWLGTNAWGHLLRSRPPHVLDFPDGHHLALETRRGSVWATTWTDSTVPRGPLRIAEVPPVDCGAVELAAPDATPAQCRDVAITAMVATRGGRVAVKLLRTDVSFVSELLLASADYGRSWEPGRPQSIR